MCTASIQVLWEIEDDLVATVDKMTTVGGHLKLQPRAPIPPTGSLVSGSLIYREGLSG